MSIFFTNFISQWGKISFYEFVYPITQGGGVVTCNLYGLWCFRVYYSLQYGPKLHSKVILQLCTTHL